MTQRPLSARLRTAAFHLAAGFALRRFERRLAQADSVNRAVLLDVLVRNANTEFGRAHDFAGIRRATDPIAAFRRRVPLQTYADLAPYVDRVAQGAPRVLTADPVHMLAGSAGPRNARSGSRARGVPKGTTWNWSSWRSRP